MSVICKQDHVFAQHAQRVRETVAEKEPVSIFIIAVFTLVVVVLFFLVLEVLVQPFDSQHVFRTTLVSVTEVCRPSSFLETPSKGSCTPSIIHCVIPIDRYLDPNQQPHCQKAATYFNHPAAPTSPPFSYLPPPNLLLQLLHPPPPTPPSPAVGVW